MNKTKCGLSYLSPDGRKMVTFATKAKYRDDDGSMVYETTYEVVLRNSAAIVDLVQAKGYTARGITYNIQ